MLLDLLLDQLPGKREILKSLDLKAVTEDSSIKLTRLRDQITKLTVIVATVELIVAPSLTSMSYTDCSNTGA